jgi:ketosteroid isomerase-like protein
MRQATEKIPHEDEVAALLETYGAAIQRKDAEATIACYAADVVAYDLAPPLRIATDAVRDPGYIQQWFDTWDGPIESEGRDLEIVVGDRVAYACGLRHLKGTKVGGERVDLWFRSTACLRRDAGSWQITHIHNSVPFAMDGSGRALLDLKP